MAGAWGPARAWGRLGCGWGLNAPPSLLFGQPDAVPERRPVQAADVNLDVALVGHAPAERRGGGGVSARGPWALSNTKPMGAAARGAASEPPQRPTRSGKRT